LNSQWQQRMENELKEKQEVITKKEQMYADLESNTAAKLTELTEQLKLYQDNHNSLVASKDLELASLRETIMSLQQELRGQRNLNRPSTSSSSSSMQIEKEKKSQVSLGSASSPIQPIRSSVSSVSVNSPKASSASNLLPSQTSSNEQKNASFASVAADQLLSLFSSSSPTRQASMTSSLASSLNQSSSSITRNISSKYYPWIPHSSNERNPDEELLHFAQIQAMRDEELNKARQQIQQLTLSIADAERMERLHVEQETLLKNEIREMERSRKREGANLDYLKNIIFQLLITNELETLLPVIATILQFSPEETQKIREKLASQQSLWSSMSKWSPWKSGPLNGTVSSPSQSPQRAGDIRRERHSIEIPSENPFDTSKHTEQDVQKDGIQ